jgi:hypothetical protein
MSRVYFFNFVFNVFFNYRVWLVHHVPVILRMKGRHIFEFVGPDGEANYVDVELFTRVMIQIESKWTNPHGNVRWRHPMNASFAVCLTVFQTW